MAKPFPVSDLKLISSLAQIDETAFDAMQGYLFLIDKPQGKSSFWIIKQLRGLTGLKKVGHAGTLDPMATGLLLVCAGKGTKAIDQLQGQVKEYEVEIFLGAATESYDAETEIVQRCPVPILQQKDIEACFKEYFFGEIEQIPPMFSAIKIQGQRLYKLARKGKSVERSPRKIHIYDYEIKSFQTPKICLRIVCSKGTYIRSIAHDLGQKLKTCSHMSALRRTKIGDFLVENAMILP